jgi:hypothetical protein
MKRLLTGRAVGCASDHRKSVMNRGVGCERETPRSVRIRWFFAVAVNLLNIYFAETKAV